MARYSGGPVTHRALTGPSSSAGVRSTKETWERELLYTLTCIQEIRGKIDRNELATVKLARQAGLSWADVATALGVSRQAAWERWREIDSPERSD
jgi:Homeodomain-like domain